MYIIIIIIIIITIINRQTCKILPIAMGLSVSVCLSVCVSVSFVCTGRTLAEIKNVKKMIFVDFDICHRMASLRKLYSVT